MSYMVIRISHPNFLIYMYLINVVAVVVDCHPPLGSLGVKCGHTVGRGQVHIVVSVFRGVDDPYQLAAPGWTLVQVGAIGMQEVAEAQKVCRGLLKKDSNEQEDDFHHW